MWRVNFIYRVAAMSGTVLKPLNRVLQILQTEGEGLPAAGNLFEEFRKFYRETTAGASILSKDLKPLEKFCSSYEDVEPFALVMMKVLCDLQKLEELRFLFAQCMLELEYPSIELFNVYLLAISLTDTFNQYEIENIVEAMRTKKIDPNIVTKISLFILYMRLGQDYSIWWPDIHEEILKISKLGQRNQYPLLEIRLQHCFQTLLRVHHDSKMIQECFELLKLIDPKRISSRLILPYMLLSTNNAATPPSTTIQLVNLLESTRKIELNLSENEFENTISEEIKNKTINSIEPVLNNELTALKLMAKCAKWGDEVSADFLRKYFNNNPGIISSTNQIFIILLHLEALARSGLLKESLTLLEDEVPDSYSQPNIKPKLFLDSRRITLLNSDPIMTLIRLVAIGGTNIEEGLNLLEERHASGGEVSFKSLNVLLEACVLLKDETRASMVFNSFSSLGVKKTARTFLLILLSSSESVSSVGRLPELLAEMTDSGIDVTPEFLSGALKMSIDAQEISLAMQIIEYYKKKQISIESKLSIRLMKLLCLVVDIDSVRQLLLVLRATQSAIDSRSLSLCIATFKKWGIPCDDLKIV